MCARHASCDMGIEVQGCSGPPPPSLLISLSMIEPGWAREGD